MSAFAVPQHLPRELVRPLGPLELDSLVAVGPREVEENEFVEASGELDAWTGSGATPGRANLHGLELLNELRSGGRPSGQCTGLPQRVDVGMKCSKIGLSQGTSPHRGSMSGIADESAAGDQKKERRNQEQSFHERANVRAVRPANALAVAGPAGRKSQVLHQ